MESYKPQEPIQETPVPISEENRSQQSEEGTPPGDQAGLHFYNFLQQYDASQHQNEIREQNRDIVDRQRLRVERRTFWVGILGLVGLLLTLRETRKATYIAAQALILDQRPWVFVKETMLVALRPNIPITAFIEYANTGRSPAFIIESSVAFRTVDSSGLPVIPDYEAPEPQNFILSPVVPQRQRQMTKKGLLPQDVAAVRNGIFQFYVYGYVRYKDSQGDEHKTGFIVLYNPKLETLDHSPHPNYTYAD